MSTTSIVGVVCLIALGGATAMLYSQNSALQERIGALEAQTELLESGSGTGDGPALGASKTQREIEVLNDEMTALAQRVNAAEEKMASAPSDSNGASPVDAATFDESVRDIVLDMAGDVRFRTKLGISGSPNLPKKPAFGQLADVLKLDATQEDEFRKDLGELQQDVFALLSEERDDGVVPLERIAAAEELPEGDPQRAQIFIELFTMKIPGADETYMQRVVEWTSDMRKRTKDYLRPEQVEIFMALDVDLLGVQMDG